MGYGYLRGDYLEFDITGVAEPGHLKNFKTDDGERLQQLLSNAGGQIAGASRLLVNQAAQASKIAVESIKARTKSDPDFFYQASGGVPSGPHKLQNLIDQVEAGRIPREVLVAEVGSTSWQSLADVITNHAKENPQEVKI